MFLAFPLINYLVLALSFGIGSYLNSACVREASLVPIVILPETLGVNGESFTAGQGPNCTYDDTGDPNNQGYVIVTTRITIGLPIPVMVLPDKTSFTTSAKVPIVAMTAQ